MLFFMAGVNFSSFSIKVMYQNLFDVMVRAGVGIVYADQFKAMLLANAGFFRVSCLHHGVVPVFAAIQPNGEHRRILSSFFLVYHKVKAPDVEQVDGDWIVMATSRRTTQRLPATHTLSSAWLGFPRNAVSVFVL